LGEINCIGVLAHPLRPESFPIAAQIEQTIRARGLTTSLHTVWAEADVKSEIEQADIVVAIGGDGAMLRAARVCAPLGIPMLGINMGQLGFLTEIARPENWEKHLARILKGDYWIERRTMIRATIHRGDAAIAAGDALNDIVISGHVFGRMIRLDAFIDDDWATTYNADALVVATATGSTAYALSCGGRFAARTQQHPDRSRCSASQHGASNRAGKGRPGRCQAGSRQPEHDCRFC
jgi:NAD+ kinase